VDLENIDRCELSARIKLKEFIVLGFVDWIVDTTEYSQVSIRRDIGMTVDDMPNSWQPPQVHFGPNSEHGKQSW